MEGGKSDNRTLRKDKQKTQITYGTGPELNPRVTLVRDEHHYATPARQRPFFETLKKVFYF